MVIMGDFNYPDICWESNFAKSQKSSRFLSFLADNFICQEVEERRLGRNWLKIEELKVIILSLDL